MTLTIDNGYQGLYTEALTYPKGYGYGARIGDYWVRLAVGPDSAVNILTQDSLAGRQADHSNPYENVLDIGYAFARANLTGGEGLDFYPREDPTRDIPLDDTRFFASSHLDLRRPEPGEPYSITLSKQFAEWYDPADSITGMTASQNRLYVAAGQYVYQFNNYVDTTPDATKDMGAGRTVTSISADNADNAICLLDNGDVYYKSRGSDSWNIVSGSPAMDDIVDLFMVKDRIMAVKEDAASPASGVQLGELALAITGSYAAPSFTPAFTLIDTFFADVTSLIDAGTAILCATTDGYIRSYVPQSDNAGDVPVLTVRGQSALPKGEYAYAMEHNAGAVVFLTDEIGLGSKTNLRAYVAELLDARFDFVVGNQSLIREWEDVSHTPDVTDTMVVDRDNVWWIINESGTSILWRYDLVTTGVFSHGSVDTGTYRNLIKFYNRLICSDAASVYRRDSLYESSGWLITPMITFGLNTDINWISTLLQAENIGNGNRIELYLSTELDGLSDWQHSSWQLVSSYERQLDTGFENNMVGLVSKFAAIQIRVYATSDQTGSPEMTRFSLRGLPKHRDWILEIPVNVSDTIEAPMRQAYRLPGWGDVVHQTMLGLAGQHLEAQIFDPPFRFRGIVDAVLEPTTYTTYRGGTSRLLMVRLRGSLITATQTISNTHVGLGVTGLVTTGL